MVALTGSRSRWLRVLLGFVAWVQHADADELARQLMSWDAPPGCSSAEAVYRRARERVGYDLELGRFGQIHGRITRQGSDLELRLELEEQGRPSTRVLHAASCDDLEGAAAVAIALALGDDRTSGLSEPAPSTPSAEPASVNEAAIVEDKAPQAESESSPGLAWVPSLGARGLLDFGSLARTAPGVGLEGRVRHGEWRFGLAASWLPASEEPVRNDEAVAFGLVSAGPRVCYQPVNGRFTAAACGSFDVGRFSASGARLSQAGQDLSHAWLSPGLGLELGVRLARGARVLLSTDGLRPLVRKEYTINGTEPVYATPELAARLGLGLDVSLE